MPWLAFSMPGHWHATLACVPGSAWCSWHTATAEEQSSGPTRLPHGRLLGETGAADHFLQSSCSSCCVPRYMCASLTVCLILKLFLHSYLRWSCRHLLTLGLAVFLGLTSAKQPAIGCNVAEIAWTHDVHQTAWCICLCCILLTSECFCVR